MRKLLPTLIFVLGLMAVFNRPVQASPEQDIYNNIDIRALYAARRDSIHTTEEARAHLLKMRQRAVGFFSPIADVIPNMVVGAATGAGAWWLGSGAPAATGGRSRSATRAPRQVATSPGGVSVLRNLLPHLPAVIGSVSGFIITGMREVKHAITLEWYYFTGYGGPFYESDLGTQLELKLLLKAKHLPEDLILKAGQEIKAWYTATGTRTPSELTGIVESILSFPNDDKVLEPFNRTAAEHAFRHYTGETRDYLVELCARIHKKMSNPKPSDLRELHHFDGPPGTGKSYAVELIPQLLGVGYCKIKLNNREKMDVWGNEASFGEIGKCLANHGKRVVIAFEDADRAGSDLVLMGLGENEKNYKNPVWGAEHPFSWLNMPIFITGNTVMGENSGTEDALERRYVTHAFVDFAKEAKERILNDYIELLRQDHPMWSEVSLSERVKEILQKLPDLDVQSMKIKLQEFGYTLEPLH